jgi:hypothetical protein
VLNLVYQLYSYVHTLDSGPQEDEQNNADVVVLEFEECLGRCAITILLLHSKLLYSSHVADSCGYC